MSERLRVYSTGEIFLVIFDKVEEAKLHSTKQTMICSVSERLRARRTGAIFLLIFDEDEEIILAVL